MANHNYYGQLAEVANSAAMAINSYDGEKVVTLATGEKAIDNDDAWMIIQGDEPIIRDKREQRIREAYKNEGSEYPEEKSSDYFILDKWSYEDICTYADELYGI